MKKIFLLVGLVVLGGCTFYSTPVINQADLQKVDFKALENQKHGEACQTVVLGIIPVSRDATISKAASEADIAHVSYVEYSSNFYWWPFYSENCVRVYGK